ncbi:MAG TPA: lysylphosphatidylglycerol synthase transmembrane domain-containing protein [Candidatus Baltobacteraceae bacterium]|nr:lysylphosphatidylglycerol synthase transmembrane domain-containing protein [Candidatus Baltobacteraceae bacterium]
MGNPEIGAAADLFNGQERPKIKWTVLIANAVLILLIGGASFAFREESTAAELLAHLRPPWIALIVLLQIGTYFCTGGAWDVVLRRFRVRTKLLSIAALGVEKVFVDQLLPTLGLGGSLMVMRGLERRGVKRGEAIAAMTIDAASYLTAFLVMSAIAASALLVEPGFSPAVRSFVIFFTVVLLVVVAAAWLFVLHANFARWPAWLLRFSMVRKLAAATTESPQDLAAGAKAGLWVVLLELAVFMLDTATLWAIFQALGYSISPIHALVTYMLASAVAMLSVIPGGLGTFDASALVVLHVFAVPFTAAAAGVVLLRVFTCLLPMLPGYIAFRFELVAHKNS